MEKNKEKNLKNELLKKMEELLKTEEHITKTNEVDQLVKIVEDMYDIQKN